MSTQTDASHYLYRVTWSEEDGEFVASCVEFPSLSWLAPMPEGALQGLRDLVVDVVTDMDTTGEVVPEPLSTKACSGKFNLRLGQQLHRRLAMESAEHHVSLNQYVVRKLTQAS